MTFSSKHQSSNSKLALISSIPVQTEVLRRSRWRHAIACRSLTKITKRWHEKKRPSYTIHYPPSPLDGRRMGFRSWDCNILANGELSKPTWTWKLRSSSSKNVWILKTHHLYHPPLLSTSKHISAYQIRCPVLKCQWLQDEYPHKSCLTLTPFYSSLLLQPTQNGLWQRSAKIS